MKYTGIDKASQEVRDALGKCEVCGAQATALVQDFFNIVPFLPELSEDLQPGKLHRFCEEHERESKITDILNGPESIRL